MADEGRRLIIFQIFRHEPIFKAKIGKSMVLCEFRGAWSSLIYFTIHKLLKYFLSMDYLLVK